MQDFIQNGNEILQQTIDKAVAQGLNKVVITGNYEFNDTVYLPSDMTIVLQDCHLKMADNTFCNMFRNENLKHQTRDFNNPDKNIRLLGVGRAILDGGTYNHLHEKNSQVGDLPHISCNWLVFFCNLENFEMDGIEVRNQRHWAITCYACKNGTIRNIRVLSDYTRIDENGQIATGLKRDLYEQIHVKNADGIDIRVGCHDILIENITGFSEDDTVAITALSDTFARAMNWTNSDEIYNITIKNVQSTAFCSNVRLLNQGGMKLYNIVVDGVIAERNEKYIDFQCGATVKLGDMRLFDSRYNRKDETYNITVKNISGGGTSCLYLAGEMKNCTFENIMSAPNVPLIENHAKIYNDN